MAGAGMMVLLIAPPPASAARISDFFKGKVVTIQVAFERGSGFDRYSRVLAKHLSRHIPGNPAVMVENTPGADSIHLANLVYHFLPQDGTVIASIAPGTAIAPLFGDKQSKFDGSKFNWLGSMNNAVSVCAVWHTVPVIFWQDLLDRETVMGGIGAISDSSIYPLVLNNIFGTRMRLVRGYPNDGYISSAVERGDLDGRCGWPWSTLKASKAKWLEKGKVRILLQMSLMKHPALQDTPLILDFARTKRDLQVLKLTYVGKLLARPYLVGPKVPRKRVSALRGAFNKTLTDKRFLADAEDQKLDLAWVDGPTVQKAVAEIYGFPEDAIAAAEKASKDRSNTQISRAVIPIEAAEGKIMELRDGGRSVSWAGEGKIGEVQVSDRRTKIIIEGQKAKRSALQLGMSCKITYRASSARKIDCQ